MKPVFSNSSNLLRKGENQIVTTEHYFQFPHFIQTLPKSGLKNNMEEYKKVLTKYAKAD